MSESIPPKVTVVIPTFNSTKFLGNTFKSVAKQTYKNLEIIFIDDCSTDGTPELIKRLAKSDPRIKLFETPSQSNLPAVPRNIGIKESTGKYIAFLDHDDIWSKKKIHIQVSILEDSPEYSMTYSPLWQFSTWNWFLGFFMIRPRLGSVSYNELLKANVIQCSSVLLARKVFDDTDVFCEALDLRAIEDYDLWLRISRDHKIYEFYKVLGRYRCLKSSTSTQAAHDLKLLNLKSRHPDLQILNIQSWQERVGFRLRKTPAMLWALLK